MCNYHCYFLKYTNIKFLRINLVGYAKPSYSAMLKRRPRKPSDMLN